MNRSKFRYGTKVTFHKHFNYIADSVDQALRDLLADYISISPDFYIEGGVVTVPGGGFGTYSVTAGSVCYKGEVMAVEAHSVLCPTGNVIFWQVSDEGVDEYPVLNLDGQVDYVMRKRKAVLTVAPVYPGEYMPLDAPRKADLDVIRFQGKLVPLGTIMPYAGAMTNFDASGKGLVGSAMWGWAVANGNNGTVDMRGLVPFGATDVPAFGAPAVNGSVAENTTPLQVVGSDVKSIAADNLPAHKHPFGDNQVVFTGTGGSHVLSPGDDYDTLATVADETGDNATPNTPFDVRQASRALVFIQSISV